MNDKIRCNPINLWSLGGLTPPKPHSRNTINKPPLKAKPVDIELYAKRKQN